MGKKSRAKQAQIATARPSPQSDGLIRLINELVQGRRFDEALRAGQTLVEDTPLNPLAHAVLGSIYAQVGSVLDAIRRYEQASRLGMQDDASLQQSLAVAFSNARLPVHALQVARNGVLLKTTGELHQQFASIVVNTEAYMRDLIGNRAITLAKAERALLQMERSSRALQADDLDRAREQAKEATDLAPNWPLIWNQRSLLHFNVNDVPSAFAACAYVLEQVDPQDPMSLAAMVRLNEVTGQTAAAEDALLRLLAVPATEVWVQEKQAEGLVLLGRDQQAYELLEPLHRQNETPLHPIGRFLLGISAANLGKSAEARAVWRNLPREGIVQVRAYLDMLARHDPAPTPDGRFWALSAGELVPSTVLAVAVQRGAADPRHTVLRETAAAFPRLSTALCEAFWHRIIDPRLAVDLLLGLEGAGVTSAVRAFATSRLPGDYDRVYAHIALRGRDLDDAATPASVWIGGRRRDLMLPKLHIAPAEPQRYSEEIARLLKEGAEAQEADDLDRAKELYQEALSIEPTLQEAEHNLGTAYLLAQDLAEGELHLRRALELDPDHVLARCNLASLDLMRGNAMGAHALLAPLDERTRFNLEEAMAYVRTRSELAGVENDLARAESLLHALLAFDHDNKQAQERLAVLASMTAAAVASQVPLHAG